MSLVLTLERMDACRGRGRKANFVFFLKKKKKEVGKSKRKDRKKEGPKNSGKKTSRTKDQILLIFLQKLDCQSDALLPGQSLHSNLPYRGIYSTVPYRC